MALNWNAEFSYLNCCVFRWHITKWCKLKTHHSVSVPCQLNCSIRYSISKPPRLTSSLYRSRLSNANQDESMSASCRSPIRNSSTCRYRKTQMRNKAVTRIGNIFLQFSRFSRAIFYFLPISAIYHAGFTGKALFIWVTRVLLSHVWTRLRVIC